MQNELCEDFFSLKDIEIGYMSFQLALPDKNFLDLRFQAYHGTYQSVFVFQEESNYDAQPHLRHLQIRPVKDMHQDSLFLYHSLCMYGSFFDLQM